MESDIGVSTHRQPGQHGLTDSEGLANPVWWAALRVFYSDPFTFPLEASNRFPADKYRLLRERVAQWPASSGVELHLAPRATEADLLLVHTPEYLRAFASGEIDPMQMRRIGFPWSPELVERSLRSCGGTVAAARVAVHDGRAAYLAGGTHHARADRGAGYCVYNDCAVAARVLQRDTSVGSVVILDTDVHQGDGTAAVFREDPSVFTFSIHGDANFPGKKERSDLDVALPAGTDDAIYLERLEAALDEVFTRVRPDFAFFLSGADPFVGDRLGTLSISKVGLQRRDEMVIGRLRRERLPWVTVMGGGYGKDIGETVDVYEATIRATAMA